MNLIATLIGMVKTATAQAVISYPMVIGVIPNAMFNILLDGR
jgi:hypothetical protein